MPENLRFFWEVETLAHLTPAILANVGVLVMTSRDVGWRMQLAMWVERRRELDREVLRSVGIGDSFFKGLQDFKMF